MYDELIARLRETPSIPVDAKLHNEAADAIEELQGELQALKDDTDMAFVKEGNTTYLRFVKKWIPVTERLPEENEAVNIVWINRSPVIYYQDIKDIPQSATGVHYKGQWYWWSAVTQDYLAEYGKWDCDKMDDAIEVTHWMPLPQPPESEGER